MFGMVIELGMEVVEKAANRSRLLPGAAVVLLKLTGAVVGGAANRSSENRSICFGGGCCCCFGMFMFWNRFTEEVDDCVGAGPLSISSSLSKSDAGSV
jgi:hypothetical protein